jgi:hypothetical protein
MDPNRPKCSNMAVLGRNGKARVSQLNNPA